MAKRGIGVPNIMVLGDGNIPWRVQPRRGGSDRTFEVPLHNVRKIARKSRKLLAANDNKPHPAHAVYVVSDVVGDVSKIGRAHCPSSRLSRIQTGNPEELFLHRVFWVDSGRVAQEVERIAHELAAPFGRMMGEWFCCKPHEAHSVIVEALDAMNIDYVAITPFSKIREAA